MAISLHPNEVDETTDTYFHESWSDATASHFTTLPNGLVRWSINPYEKTVLLVLVSWSDKTGRVSRRLHQKNLAEWSGMSLRQVQITLSKLKERGLIEVTPAPARASEFLIHLDKIAKLLPEPPCKEPEPTTKPTVRKAVAGVPTSTPPASVLQAPPAVQSGVRPNKWDGKCDRCGGDVLAGEGKLVGKVPVHLDCEAWKTARSEAVPKLEGLIDGKAVLAEIRAARLEREEAERKTHGSTSGD